MICSAVWILICSDRLVSFSGQSAPPNFPSNDPTVVVGGPTVALTSALSGVDPDETIAFASVCDHPFPPPPRPALFLASPRLAAS